jgi:cysteine synthase
MMHNALPKVRDSVLETIGNTPVVQLKRVVPPGSADVLVKLEYYNPTGSYKDRMALAMIEEAEKRGDLRPGMTVVEYTGGSTGSSLALICAVKGYPFRVVSSDAFAQEKLRTMEAFGAELEILPSDGGMITPDLIPRLIARAQEIVKENNGYPTDQFRNSDSLKGYEKIALELMEQVDRPIDAVCGGVGTAGMMMGVGRAFKAAGHPTRIVILEPASSPMISTGTPGKHHVEGIGTGFIPPLLNQNYYDEVRTIDETEAREMARRVAREEGVFGGVSTGLNIVAALQLARELGTGYTVATIACDFGLKYLAGDLYQ